MARADPSGSSRFDQHVRADRFIGDGGVCMGGIENA